MSSMLQQQKRKKKAPGHQDPPEAGVVARGPLPPGSLGCVEVQGSELQLPVKYGDLQAHVVVFWLRPGLDSKFRED
jgi:hypothetical protein